jgi:hypothetical protein
MVAYFCHMKVGIILAGILCASAFGCGKGPSQGSSCVENREILQEVRAYYKDMSRRNWNAYRDHFWPNATITTAWTKPGDSLKRVHVITIDEFIRETPNGPDSQPVFSEEMTSSRIECTGNLAIVWTDYSVRFGKPDSLMEWEGRDLFTWMKLDRQWRIVSLVFEAVE